MEKGILDKYKPLSIAGSSGHYMRTSNQEALRLFQFLAEKSNVEYSLIRTSQGNYITTSHQQKREELGVKVMVNFLSQGIGITEHYHNHPIKFPECLGPSGGILPCDRNTNGDAQVVKEIQEKFPNSSIRFIVYEPSAGYYYEYDSSRIINQWIVQEL